FTGMMRGSAGLYSTARDLIAYAAASLRNDGTSLSAALGDTLRIRYPRIREAAAVNWIVDDVNDQQIEYQVGFIAGYSSYIGLNPRNHTAVVILQNAFNWDFSAGHELVLWLADHNTAFQ
ncbi:MAG TPA: serine hydrolase, partial [Stellaceae bacterium]|nr:serine hydrolase [Stellaceae bacterium]